MSNSPNLTFSTLRPILTGAWRLVLLSTSHPFILRPAFWLIAFISWLAALVVLLETGIDRLDVYVYAGLIVLLAAIVGGLYGWRRLVAPSERMIVFLTRLAGKTTEAAKLSVDQLDALIERLQDNPVLRDCVEFRALPVPVSENQARVLLDETPARAIVFGTARTAGDTALWKTELLLRWPGAEHNVTAHLENGTVELFNRKVDVPLRHEGKVDPQQPIERLTAEHFESNHADHIEGTVLTLVGTALLDEGYEKEAVRALAAAGQFRQAVSAQTRAAIETGHARLSPPKELSSSLDRLEAAGNADADHADLWNCAVALNYLLKTRSKIWMNRHLGFAERAVRANPNDPTAHYNLGEALMAVDKPKRALHEFEIASQHPEYADRYYVHFALGIINYNLGRYEDARNAYQRVVELHPTARAHLYLADAHRQLGEDQGARHHYRQTLLLEPTLVDAHRGYWFTEPNDVQEFRRTVLFDRITQPMFSLTGRSVRLRRLARPILWRLLKWHHRRHPEDSRVHYMLGAQALLRGEFEFAEERLRFALKLIPDDLQALARLAVTRGLQGRLIAAKNGLVRIKHAPRLPGRPGDPVYPYPIPDSDLARLWDIMLPFLDEPRLFAFRHADKFVEIVEELFGESIEEFTEEC